MCICRKSAHLPASARKVFKVGLLLNLPYEITTELTFENVFNRRKIQKSLRATELAIQNHCRLTSEDFQLVAVLHVKQPENPGKSSRY